MSPRKPLKTKEITELLSKLKDATPEYPAEMMTARKAAFLKQAVHIKFEGKGQGGEGGQQGGGSGSVGSGGTGAALGGGTAAPSVLLQALIGISIVAGMFLAAYALRDPINDTMQRSEAALEEVAISSPLAPDTVTAVPSSLALATPPAEIILTETPDDLENTEINGASVIQGTPLAGIASDVTKTNSGLHLGQTPGTPAAPGQGNPGNPNKPDKDKPEKPGNPNKPEKPPKKPK